LPASVLNGTLDLPFDIRADNLKSLKTWVDVAYVVHNNMKATQEEKSHTGGGISLGRGAIMCKSTKQKLNIKCSTEAEVVSASDYYVFQASGSKKPKRFGSSSHSFQLIPP